MEINNAKITAVDNNWLTINKTYQNFLDTV